MSEEITYYARQKVPRTGLFRVYHFQHRLPHDAMMRQGELFPACNTCGQRVFFRLSHTAEPLTLDRDFLKKAA